MIITVHLKALCIRAPNTSHFPEVNTQPPAPHQKLGIKKFPSETWKHWPCLIKKLEISALKVSGKLFFLCVFCDHTQRLLKQMVYFCFFFFLNFIVTVLIRVWIETEAFQFWNHFDFEISNSTKGRNFQHRWQCSKHFLSGVETPWLLKPSATLSIVCSCSRPPTGPTFLCPLIKLQEPSP